MLYGTKRKVKVTEIYSRTEVQQISSEMC